MEIRLRTLLLILVLLAGGALAAVVTFGLRSPTAPAAAPTVEADVGQVQAYPAIAFTDSSEKLDWEVGCEEALWPWLDAHPDVCFSSLTVTLVDGEALESLRPGSDSRALALGVAYPDPYNMQALAMAGCAGGGDVKCYVTLESGGPGEDADVALAVAWVYALEHHLTPKTKEAWENSEWKWENYQPLIAQERDRWVSVCLHLSSQ